MLALAKVYLFIEGNQQNLGQGSHPKVHRSDSLGLFEAKYLWVSEMQPFLMRNRETHRQGGKVNAEKLGGQREPFALRAVWQV